MAPALALLASLCYGLSNFIGPTLSRDLPVYAVLIAGQFVAFCVSATVVLATADAVPGVGVAGAAALAGVGNAWGLIAFYRAASIGPLSLVTPIGSLGALVPVTAGVAGGEPLGPVKLAGLVLALGGVALATRRREPPAPEIAPAQPEVQSSSGRQGARSATGPRGGGGGGGGAGTHEHDVRRSALWALSSALGFGVFLTFMAPAADGGIFWAVLLSRTTLLIVLGGAAIALAATQLPPLRRLPSVAVPGLLLFAGTLSYSAATREGDLSVVSVLGSLFPIVTVGLAFALLGERLRRVQAIGVGGALAGVVLVSMRA